MKRLMLLLAFLSVSPVQAAESHSRGAPTEDPEDMIYLICYLPPGEEWMGWYCCYTPCDIGWREGAVLVDPADLVPGHEVYDNLAVPLPSAL